MGFGKQTAPFVTLWEDHWGKSIDDASKMTPKHLVQIIKDAPPARDKDHLAMIKLAEFGDQWTYYTDGPKKGRRKSLRHDKNVIAVYGVEGDYDGEKRPLTYAVKKLTAAGIAAVLYTSASHEAEAPRWRVLVFLSMPITGTTEQLKKQRAYYTGVLNALLGGILTPESFALSQSYYYGPVKGRSVPEVRQLTGVCIDQIKNPPAPVYPTGKRPSTNEHPQKTPVELRTKDPARTQSQMAVLKNDDIDYEPADGKSFGYFTMLCAINGAYGAEEGWPIALAWSEQSTKHDENYTRERWDSINPPRIGAEAIEAWAKAAGWKDSTKVDTAPELLTLVDMLERFVHISKGPQIIDVTNIRRTYTSAEFSAAYAHCRKREKNEEGDVVKTIPMTKLWTTNRQRMSADVRTFNPAKAQFFIENGLRQFNSWWAPEWPEVGEEYAAPFFEHIDYLIPDKKSRHDLLDWLAHAVQKPGERPHYHFLLLAQSNEGIGRSWLVDLFMRLWTERHAGVIDLHRLIDDTFNSELSGKIIVGVNEVRVPSEEKYSKKDRIKSLLTDTYITVNEKNEKRWVELFVTRFLMLTNRDDALQLSENDRRTYVARCADTPKSKQYYRRLYRQLHKRKFLSAVWTVLQTRDLSQFNPGERAPLNEAKQQMIDAGRSSEQQTAVDLVKVCPYPIISAKDLMATVIESYDNETGKDRRIRTNSVVAALKDLGKQPLSRKVRIDDSITRVWVLEDVAKWCDVASSELVARATKAGVVFKAHNWNAQKLIDEWTKTEEEGDENT
jgi:Family of unknown function (DUF5906)